MTTIPEIGFLFSEIQCTLRCVSLDFNVQPEYAKQLQPRERPPNGLKPFLICTSAISKQHDALYPSYKTGKPCFSQALPTKSKEACGPENTMGNDLWPDLGSAARFCSSRYPRTPPPPRQKPAGTADASWSGQRT